MKFVKRFLLVVILFNIIAIIISLFLPSSLHLERKIIIDADKNQIFKQVNDLKNWKNWAPWVLLDSTVYLVEENYSSQSQGVGANFRWDSENDKVGKGKMEIIESKKNQLVEYKVDFGKGEMFSGFYLKDVAEGVEVIWMIDVNFGFNPISKFFGLFMEDYIGADYELGLKRLKSYAEELPKINSVKVEKLYLEKQWILSLRDTINQLEMSNIHGKMFAQISKFMNENEIKITDAPIVIYHFWSDSIIDIEAGIPTIDSIEVKDTNIQLNQIAAGNVVTAIHYGPYERLIETYNGINEWMRKNEVVVTGPPWEKYITDPSIEPNPEKWQTAIFFPIQ